MPHQNSSAIKLPSSHGGLAYVPAFHFDETKSCYCHSGLAFGACCKQNELSQSVPKGINVINNFISATDCKRFIRFAEKQKRAWLTVVDSNKSVGKNIYKRDPSRVTQNVSLGKKQDQATEWIRTACLERLRNAEPQWFESPQLLRYEPNGKYNLHSDAEHFDHETKQFYRFIDRDFSLLIYLNDNYEGGGISFPWLNYTYQPKAGDLVFFPSNHIFSHESLPIEAGNKYALVSWGALKGTARVKRPKGMIGL